MFDKCLNSQTFGECLAKIWFIYVIILLHVLQIFAKHFCPIHLRFLANIARCLSSIIFTKSFTKHLMQRSTKHLGQCLANITFFKQLANIWIKCLAHFGVFDMFISKFQFCTLYWRKFIGVTISHSKLLISRRIIYEYKARLAINRILMSAANRMYPVSGWDMKNWELLPRLKMVKDDIIN